MVEIRDSLQRQNLDDRWLFLFFAVTGSVAIVAIKSLSGIPTWVVAAGAVSVMTIYALIAGRGSGKLRADQAGDNCYYLGLIYTLVSLSHAIFTFELNTGIPITIVQGFGVALATTIWGLILRVFLNLFRFDLHEFEEEASRTLAEAAVNFRTQIAQTTNDFKDFSFGLQQSMKEMRRATTDGLKKSSEESLGAIRSMAANANENIGKQTAEYGAKVESLSASVARSQTAIESQIQSLDKIIWWRQSTLGSDLETLTRLSDTAGTSLTAVVDAAEKLEKSINLIIERQESSNRDVERLASQIHSNATALTAVAAAVEKLEKKLKRSRKNRIWPRFIARLRSLKRPFKNR